MKNITILEKIEMTDEQKERLNKLGNVRAYESSTLEECIERVKEADVVVVDWIEPNPFLEYMKPNSLLALMSTGYSWVDVKKARSLGISVANIPGYAREAVAEHLFGLALSILKGITLGDRVIRKGGWKEGQIEGLELANKTLGIIGLGRNGTRMAEIGQKGFNMNVITYNRTPKNILGIKEVSLEEILRESDIIAITCDLNPTSKNLIGGREFLLMKSTAVIVSATWGVIDIPALVDALKNKKIFGAGLDIEVGEKPELPMELLELDNVVLTPHTAYKTRESQIRRVDICIDNIKSFLEGKPKNIVN
jgi:D-3-phosphoglycerate dehydrogenase